MKQFENTKWDQSTWSEEQKIKWQEKCFDMGYRMGGGVGYE